MSMLSRDFRKHLLHHLFTEFLSPIAEAFTEAYGKAGFRVLDRCISWQPISFCREAGARLDVTLHVEIDRKAKYRGKCVTLGFMYEQDDQSGVKYQAQYQFDLLPQGT